MEALKGSISFGVHYSLLFVLHIICFLLQWKNKNITKRGRLFLVERFLEPRIRHKFLSQPDIKSVLNDPAIRL